MTNFCRDIGTNISRQISTSGEVLQERDSVIYSSGSNRLRCIVIDNALVTQIWDGANWVEQSRVVSQFVTIVYVTLGLIWYRKLRRDGMYVIDYSSDGGLTWELDLVVLALDEDSIIMDIDAGVAGYRHEVRGTAYKIDHALTPTAFAGAENTDWENIYST